MFIGEINTIKHDHLGDTLRLSAKAKTALEKYTPKGCPFKDYTLCDLLFDWVKMYGWMISGEISVKKFVGMIKDRDVKAEVYGDVICRIIKEV